MPVHYGRYNPFAYQPPIRGVQQQQATAPGGFRCTPWSPLAPSLPPQTSPGAPSSGGDGDGGLDASQAAQINNPNDFTSSAIGTGVGPITQFISGALEGLGYDPTNTTHQNVANAGVNTVIDAATGLPFGIASTLVNPTIAVSYTHLTLPTIYSV